MSETTITNLSGKEFILHSHVLAPFGQITLDDGEITGDWEILRPLNWAVLNADVTTDGAVIFPDWTDYPGGVADQSARDVNPVAVGGPRFLALLR